MRPILFSAAGVFLLASAVQAQVPAGGEFQVNTWTPSYQWLPAIAAEHDGDFIVVWSSLWQDGDQSGVYAQRYDATGARRGLEFQVSAYWTGAQQGHAVAVDGNGNFVVVWSSDPPPAGQQRGIFGQRFDGLGNRVGGEFQMNTFTPSGSVARVAMTPAGAFVVVWDSFDGDNYGVFARRYDAAGSPLGAEFRVNTTTAQRQMASNIGMDPGGNFVIVWTGDSFGYDVFAQRFTASGARIGGEFRVNTTTAGHQGGPGRNPAIAVGDDGAFTVIWDQWGVQPAPVIGQRFDAAGNRIGAEFPVDTDSGSGSPSNIDVAIDARGNLTASWTDHTTFPQIDVLARRFDRAGAPRGGEVVVNTYTTFWQFGSSVAADDVGNLTLAWHSYRQEGANTDSGIYAQRFGGLRPQALAVDVAGNRVLDPGETAVVQPSWRNINGASLTFGGALTELTGPTGATYTLADGTGAYGTVANAAIGSCTDCYGVQVSGPRPATHWDASAVETITPDTLGQQKQWVLHVGGSFDDVSTASPFYRFIETLLHRGVTGGCSASSFCPASSTSRAQMAVFALVAKEGAAYAPPACVAGAEMFSDLPASSPFCRWVEELARRGVVAGCGTGQYCPVQSVVREQMAIFALATLEGPAYQPPACVTPMYADVPAASPFCRWIEELTRRGVVSGCGGGNYCPTAGVTREQMGVFLSVAFGLTLYGP